MPASLASLPGELHARIASMCALQDERFKYAKLAIRSPTFPLADPEPAERWTTVGALSVVSKYWNKVTEPYRFSKLKAAHLASRKFRSGFGRKFGRYITELDLTDLCNGSEPDPTIVLDALPSLPNLRTIVTPVMSNVVGAVVRGVDYDNGGPSSDPQQTRPEVAFVTDGFINLFAAVPSLVVYVLAGEMHLFHGLAMCTPQTRQLVLYDRAEAEPSAIIVTALVAIQSFPLLSELKLVMVEDLHVDPTMTSCAEFAAPLSELVRKLSPHLHSLDLLAERFGRDDDDGKTFPDGGFPNGVDHFPQLKTFRGFRYRRFSSRQGMLYLGPCLA
ncbi:hypothetical protein RHOSPDRAFT_35144 [Rhodotorula sp. JG-1b]|nr:hypothetical protein RHOSPDRAFT_35144 [Rhodotorula sp. JG-1b]